MHVSIEEKDQGIIILSFNGRIDATTAGLFEDSCKKAFNGDIKTIIIDMEFVEYISSAGLRAVLTIMKLGKQQPIKLLFCSLGEMVSEVFRISGFNTILAIYKTKKEALAALSG